MGNRVLRDLTDIPWHGRQSCAIILRNVRNDRDKPKRRRRHFTFKELESAFDSSNIAQLPPQVHGVNGSVAPSHVKALVESAWNFILGPQDSYPKDFDQDTAFYDVWG